VQPIATRNTVEVRYRVNGGADLRSPAPLARTDVRTNAQYFVASLPEFRVGDTVEYGAVCNCAGRQVPSPESAGKLASSFRVMPAASLSASHLAIAARTRLAGVPHAPLEAEKGMVPALTQATPPSLSELTFSRASETARIFPATTARTAPNRPPSSSASAVTFTPTSDADPKPVVAGSPLLDYLKSGKGATSSVGSVSGAAAATLPVETRVFTVRGQVTSNGFPVPNIHIVAFDMDLRGMEALNQPVETDDNGNYTIGYTSAEFSNAEAGTADLAFLLLDSQSQQVTQFQALNGSGQPLPVLQLPLDLHAALIVPVQVLHDAGPDETVNFKIAPGAVSMPSEYDHLIGVLTPLLSNVVPLNNPNPSVLDRLADLKPQDIDFLAFETEVERGKIDSLVSAVKLSLDPFRNNVGPQAFYGLARVSGWSGLSTLAKANVAGLRSTLLASAGIPGNPGSNIIPLFPSEDALNETVDQIHTVATTNVLTVPAAEGRAPLNQVLATVLPTTDAQQALVRSYANSTGSTAEFWAALSQTSGFEGPGKIASIQFALGGATLADHRPKLVELLQTPGKYKSLRDLALTTGSLADLTKQIPVEQLADIPGATQVEKATNYATRLQTKLQHAFPTETCALLMNTVLVPVAQRPQLQSVSEFLLRASAADQLGSAATFDIRTTHVDSFIRQFGDRLFQGTSPEQRTATIAGVKRAQRLFAISADPPTFSALFEAGFTSARQVASIPRGVFISEFKNKLGGGETAAFIHGKATAIGLAGAHLAVEVHQATADVRPAAVGSSIKVLPQWAELFGSVKLCECSDCRSVLGPAAYLVDLLQFLDRPHARGNDAGLYPLDYLIGKPGVLDGRRPDLSYLQLTCENTNTPLPYVDLVNEVLEGYVVIGKPSKEAGHDVGDATPRELLANPQYVSSEAYTILSGKAFPPSLPFDRSLEATRLYLTQFQTSRLDLMRAFVLPDGDRWSPAMVAETLRFTAKEYEILTGKTFAGVDAPQDVKALYGLDGTPGSLGTLIQERPIRDLLTRTGLSYLELIGLLKARFINPAQQQLRLVDKLALTGDEQKQLESSNFTQIPLSVLQKLARLGRTVDDLRAWFAALNGLVVLFAEQADCNLDNTILQRKDGNPVDDDTLLSLHRFLRLWRKLGCSVEDLDRILLARGFAANPAKSLSELAQLRQILGDGVQSIAEVLTLWSRMDSFGDGSLYTRLFYNRAVSPQPDPDFELTPEEDELKTAKSGTPRKLLDKLKQSARLQAALRVRAADLAVIVQDASFDQNSDLNLENISTLCRYVFLSRNAGIPLRLLIELRHLGGADPFTNPLGTLALLELTGLIQGSGLSLTQIANLSRHSDPGGLITAATDRAIKALVTELIAGLGKLADQRTLLVGTSANPASPTAEQLRTEIANLPLATTNLNQLGAIVEGTSKLSDAAKTDFLKTNVAALLDDTQIAKLIPNVTANPRDPDSASAAEETRITRRVLVLGPVLAFLERSFIRETVADALGIPQEFRSLLLENANALHSVQNNALPALNDFVAPDDPPPAFFVDSFRRLEKVSTIIRTVKLTPDELTFFVAHPASFAGLDLNALPVSPVNGKAVFAMIVALVRYAALRGDDQGRFQLIACYAAGDPATRQTAIASRTGLREEQVKEAIDQLGIADTLAASTGGLQSIFALLALSSIVGASPSQLRAWAGGPSAEIAAAVRDALKAKFNQESWLEVARSISDSLRTRQRDSLIAHVLTMPSIKGAGVLTANQLFEYFLIDTQMEQGMITSRIKQAICSVQLFVDRCLLDVETEIRPSALDAGEWEWRKNFVIWQANRKIFLQPENYAEPEVRDDKTPFFKELESELQQTDISAATAESALAHYLAKVDEVARLETCGTFLEWPTDSLWGSNLHVIGRTRDVPSKYFYRRFVDSANWTAWEQVNVEIHSTDDDSGSNSGVQVLPVVWKGRLYLFWLTFSNKADQPGPTQVTAGMTLKQSQPFWQIKLAWSLYENGQWSQKRLSSGSFDFPPAYIAPDGKARHDVYLSDPRTPGDFRLRAVVGDSLEILVLTEFAASGGGLVPRGVGEFVIDNRNDGFRAAQTWRMDQNEVHAKDARPSFMALRTNSDLTLLLPSGSKSQILQNPGNPYRLLSLQQQNPVAVDAPYVVETNHAGYLCPARKDTIWSPRYLGNPANVGPALVKSSNLIGANTQYTLSPTTVRTIAHPWMASQVSLLGQLTQSSSGSLLAGLAANTNQMVYFEIEDVVRLRFLTTFHPWTGEFTRRLNAGGVNELLTLDTQALGNPHLREPWRDGYIISPLATGPGCLIEGGYGRVDRPGGTPGNLEVVLLEGSNLVHYWHDSSNALFPWQRSVVISNQATGPGCLIERVSERKTDPNGLVLVRGRLEVAVLEGNNLVQYTRTDPDLSAWAPNPNGLITTQAKGPGCIIETEYITGGLHSLDVLVPEPGSDPTRTILAHYRLDNATGKWGSREVLSDQMNTPGAACFIQSGFKVNGHGNFEAAVLECNPTNPESYLLVHYWKKDDQPSWNRGVVVSDRAAGPGWLIESRIKDAGDDWPGNFELIVPEGDARKGPWQLVHYWRDNSVFPEFPWHRGQVITDNAQGPASLYHGHVFPIGNFELVVPEAAGLKHYWHMNEGLSGTTGERFYFTQAYAPTSLVDSPYARHDVDFSSGGPYSVYNWELFFHIPLMIALQLHRNQRFAEARTWLHRIFNPLVGSNDTSVARFWQVLPLRNSENANIEQLLAALSSKDGNDASLKSPMEIAIDDWEKNPFQPHRIARHRPVAYKKNVVMKYLDILFADGDYYFEQNTIESINLAIQRYVLAANILGPRPETIPQRTKFVAKTYNDLRAEGLDAFSNTLEEVENEFPFMSNRLAPIDGGAESAAVLGSATTLYFCVPHNDKLLSYWDRLDDRLYKIRHSMNFQGVVQQLPLFEPPIDPALLVQALAQGVPLSTVISDMGAALPYYRFNYVLSKAVEFCADLKSIAALLQAAFEKGDAEGLARMRALHETTLLNLIHEVRKQQVAEANASLNGLLASRETAVTRWQHYRELLGEDTTVPDPPNEPADFKAVPDTRAKANLTLVSGGAIKVSAPPSPPTAAGILSLPKSLSLPGLPSLPSPPSLPSLPGMSFLPGLPSLPSLPSLPDLTSLPGLPSLPDLSSLLGLNLGPVGVDGVPVESFDTGAMILDKEEKEFEHSVFSTQASVASQASDALAATLHLVPGISVNLMPLGIGATISFGGEQLGAGATSIARVLGAEATVHGYMATRSGKLATIVLRERDWVAQANQAAREIDTIHKQLLAAKLRVDIAKQEQVNHEQQMANAVEIEDFLKTKVTNRELYSFMQGALGSIWSEAHKLTRQMALKAEQCYRFERGTYNTNFISPSGYTGLHQSFMEAERLHLSLKQMERAYLDQNQREYELTKHISVAALDPLQLIQLKETGTCEIDLPEQFFDMDYPGHYFRRIKSVSLTIPCVIGPYETVNASLRLLRHELRVDPTPGTQYQRQGDDDRRFLVNLASTQAVATSSAQQDSGLFEVNFKDERYLPFEGAGVISHWQLCLASPFRKFDYETVTDIILHVHYTSREGGDRLKGPAVKALKDYIKQATDGRGSLYRLVSLRHEFPSQWNALLRPAAASEPDPVTRNAEIILAKDRFPFYLFPAAIQPQVIYAIAATDANAAVKAFTISTTAASGTPGSADFDLNFQPEPSYGKALFAKSDDGINLPKVESDPTKSVWIFKLSTSKADMATLQDGLTDLFVVINYVASMGS
jgi:hypothetical protein